MKTTKTQGRKPQHQTLTTALSLIKKWTPHIPKTFEDRPRPAPRRGPPTSFAHGVWLGRLLRGSPSCHDASVSKHHKKPNTNIWNGVHAALSVIRACRRTLTMDHCRHPPAQKYIHATIIVVHPVLCVKHFSGEGHCELHAGFFVIRSTVFLVQTQIHHLRHGSASAQTTPLHLSQDCRVESHREVFIMILL